MIVNMLIARFASEGVEPESEHVEGGDTRRHKWRQEEQKVNRVQLRVGKSRCDDRVFGMET